MKQLWQLWFINKQVKGENFCFIFKIMCFMSTGNRNMLRSLSANSWLKRASYRLETLQDQDGTLMSSKVVLQTSLGLTTGLKTTF